MKKLTSLFLSSFILFNVSANASTPPKVVVSIKPIHSLVTGIMEGVAEPDLIIKTGSPHGYTLRPSEAKALADSDLVVWVGHNLESFLEKPLKNVAKNAQQLTLEDKLKSSLLTKRSGEEWEKHEHHHEEGEHHDEHGHEEDMHHDEHEAHEDEHHDKHEEHKSSMDLHIWLSPTIAQKIVIETTKKLVEIDPDNAAQYNSNSTALLTKLIKLDNDLKIQLEPVQNKPYIVFHSAYQYFETSYGLSGIGSVTVDPERKPGAKTVKDIREKVVRLNAHCVFSEPQFESSIVATIIEGTDIKTGVIDPLGANIPAGKEAYFSLMNNLADGLKNCLQ